MDDSGGMDDGFCLPFTGSFTYLKKNLFIAGEPVKVDESLFENLDDLDLDDDDEEDPDWNPGGDRG